MNTDCEEIQEVGEGINNIQTDVGEWDSGGDGRF